MNMLQRQSPVRFFARPVQTEVRDGWTVIMEYADEGNGLQLIDLSHSPKWDIQDKNLSRLSSAGITIPENPGDCAVTNRMVICRRNQTQAAVWHLGGDLPDMLEDQAVTDVTEAFLLLALTGPHVYNLMEKITSLDLKNPEKTTPRLVQGPVLHVPCMVLDLGRTGDRETTLIACSRGYGRNMTTGILHAGGQWGISPAGEAAFARCLTDIMPSTNDHSEGDTP